MATLSFTPKGVVGTAVVFAVAVLFIRLGFWQLERLDERQEHNAAIADRIESPPATLTGPIADTAGLVHRQVIVRGTYDHARSIVLAGRSRRGLPGVHVLTPLLLSGSRAAVLVNRGWLPSPDAATVDLEPIARAGPVRLHGIALPFPERTLPTRAETAGDDGFQRVWYRFDAGALRAQFPYPILDLYVQALPAPDAPEYPERLGPPELGEGPHLSYAIQWFSFAAIAVLGWAALVMRREPDEPRVAPTFPRPG